MDSAKPPTSAKTAALDLADPVGLAGPPELDVVRPVLGNPRADQLERQRRARPLQMREEMQLGFLGDPVGTSHRVDELFGVVHERAGVGDSLAAFVVVPAPAPPGGA